MLSDWRNREGLSQAQAADVMNVSQQTYSTWERGVSYPRAAAELVVVLALGGFLAGAADEAIKHWRESQAA